MSEGDVMDAHSALTPLGAALALYGQAIGVALLLGVALMLLSAAAERWGPRELFYRLDALADWPLQAFYGPKRLWGHSIHWGNLWAFFNLFCAAVGAAVFIREVAP